MEVKKYQINLGNFDGVYLRFEPGKLYFGDTGRMHYFASKRCAQGWIDSISKIYGSQWKSRMYVEEVTEYLMEYVDLCDIQDIFKGWEDCSYDELAEQNTP